MSKNCSFCGSSESEESRLLEGADAYICENCIISAYKIFFDTVDENEVKNQEEIMNYIKDFSIPTSIIKNFLISKNGYLLSDENNGKVISLNGLWGSGKTYFWKNELEPILQSELLKKNKVVVYISLYGKNSIDELKEEILLRAYENINDKNKKISSTVSTITNIVSKISPTLSLGLIRSNPSNTLDLAREYILNGEKNLRNGGIICLDDFERKSSKIDLFDLFGFITNLAIELNIKIFIILNSFSFDEEKAKIFSKVKEKSIDKFLVFHPSMEDLFYNIFSNSTYKNKLENYSNIILKSLKETNELNARIYKQALDNCYQWVINNNEVNDHIIRALVLASTNFSSNNLILDYEIFEVENDSTIKEYKIFRKFHFLLPYFHKNKENFSKRFYTQEEFINILNTKPSKFSINDINLSTEEKIQIKKFQKDIYALYFYGYFLNYSQNIDDNIIQKINNLVKTGISF